MWSRAHTVLIVEADMALLTECGPRSTAIYKHRTPVTGWNLKAERLLELHSSIVQFAEPHHPKVFDIVLVQPPWLLRTLMRKY